MGVFATRSPFRPNPIGLSSVKLIGLEEHETYGPILHVAGADLMDGTPIYDIKPYLPFTDSHPDAKGGFAMPVLEQALTVEFPADLLERLPESHRNSVIEVLAEDPRPSYQNDKERIYGLTFAGFDIRFQVQGDVLTVCEVVDILHTDP